MPHRKGHLTFSLIGEVVEFGLFITHAIDHLLPGSTHHRHDWSLRSDPEHHGRSVLVVEGCNCGALRYDRLAYNADRLCFERRGCTIV